MNYYIAEKGDDVLFKNAAGKARRDIDQIFQMYGMREIQIPFRRRETAAQRIQGHFKVRETWEKAFSSLQKGDCVFVQFPAKEHSLFFADCMRAQQKKGIRIFLLIHDIRYLRYRGSGEFSAPKKQLMRIEEKSAFRQCDGIIVHNLRMSERLLASCRIPQEKIVSLDIFDYLMPDAKQENKAKKMLEKNLPVIIAGNLLPNKARYLEKLPPDCEFNLYGDGYAGKKQANVHYQGAFLPDEIPFVLSGSFGLIWDGDSEKTCCGTYGEYLKMNNPHKTSLYLAAGIPVIVWSKAAIAEFVLANQCGITVDSLYDIKKKLDEMTDEAYQSLKKAAQEIGEKLKKGFYTQKAVANIVEKTRGGGYSLSNTIVCFPDCLQAKEAA